MKVKDKYSDEVFEVFSVKESAIFTYFLVFREGEWVWVDANYFVPVTWEV